MDATIVNRTMPKNKTPKALKLSRKTKKPKNTPNVSKLSKICRKQLQFLLPSKTTML
jgi:hypothetical protein